MSASSRLLRYRDRRAAGRQLATRLAPYRTQEDVLVLALPRGGVPVAYEVARALRAPLDLLLARKLGVPGHEELAMGAIASGGTWRLNDEVVQALRIPSAAIQRVAEAEAQELARRERLYRGHRQPPSVRGRTILLVDDGLATGATMRAAIAALRQQEPARVVVAVPVASVQSCASLASEADEILCLQTPDPFRAVGLWYEDFSQTTDAEVRALLEQAWGAGEGDE